MSSLPNHKSSQDISGCDKSSTEATDVDLAKTTTDIDTSGVPCTVQTTTKVTHDKQEMRFPPSSYMTPPLAKDRVVLGVSTMCRAPLRRPRETVDASPMDVDGPDTSTGSPMELDTNEKKA